MERAPFRPFYGPLSARSGPGRRTATLPAERRPPGTPVARSRSCRVVRAVVNIETVPTAKPAWFATSRMPGPVGDPTLTLRSHFATMCSGLIGSFFEAAR
jgi:hypothetical protein